MLDPTMLGSIMAGKVPHILIFGAGSVGGYLGGRLMQGVMQGLRSTEEINKGISEGELSGPTPHRDMLAHITLLGRPSMTETLRTKGLTLTHHSLPSFDLPLELIHAVDNIADCLRPDGMGPDIIALCVKSQDTQAAAEQIKAQGWAAPIISWQNGIGNAARLRGILPNNIIIPAVVPFNITRPHGAQFHCGTGGVLHMGTGEAGQKDRKKTAHAHVALFAALMAAAGEPVQSVPDIEAYQWGKLIINLNNALNALHGGALRAGFRDRHYRRALAVSWQEALGIITASGVEPKFFNGTDPYKFIKLLRLPSFIFAPIFARLIKMDAAARSSMLDDLEAGKNSEIDFLQGAIIDLAKDQGQDAPVNQALYGAVTAAFAAGLSPKMTGREIWEAVSASEL